MSVRQRLYVALASRKSQVAPSAAQLDAIGRREVDSRAWAEPATSWLAGTRIGRRLIADTWVYRVSPATRPASRRIVYYHGGGYTGGPSWMTWYIVGRLARRLQAQVWVPCYRLAPRQTAAETVPKSAAVYLAAHESRPAMPIAVVGDSAGGGLALAVAQRARTLTGRGPDALGLISPWSDLTCPDTDVDDIDLRDPFLSTASGIATARLYAGALPLDDPLVSPLYGQLQGLGPTWLFGGDCDILIYQIRRLRAALVRAGVPVEFVERPGGVHVEPLFPTPPGSRLAESLLGFLQRTLN